jgi:photosystem II stability/assembly factor-like uncharacterized protein
MILLSPGGDTNHRATQTESSLAVGTTDGVFLLEREDDGSWRVAHHALAGCFVAALTRASDGTLFAATHGIGMARSDDNGRNWRWINNGITQFDLWAARAGKLGGRDVVLAGSMPAHLFASDDRGETWREWPALRQVDSVGQWTFPPPPRLGHVKDIVIDNDDVYVGIEIGALLRSRDGGKSFTDLHIDPDPGESDVHRILIHPARPGRILIANGLMGLMRSENNGETWTKDGRLPEMDYPDAYVMHPDNPDLLFVSAAVGWPPHWYKLGRARGKIARSRDAGRTWERLLGGLPDGQRGLFGAMTIATSGGATAIYAGDSDGQIFESRDGGDTWSIIADVAPVSKGDFYRAMAKGRAPIANLDDMAFNAKATERIASKKV